MLAIGVDLGKRRSHFAVIDDTGKVFVSRKVPNRRTKVQAFLRSLPGRVGPVVCETCTNTAGQRPAPLIRSAPDFQLALSVSQNSEDELSKSDQGLLNNLVGKEG